MAGIEDLFKMARLTGMLLDVSGSMADNAGEIQQEGGEWVNSIFEVMDNLIKHDLTSENEVFAVGVGSMFKSGLFDVLRTIKPFKDISGRCKVSYDIILDSIYSILERNGARQIRKWAQSKTVKSVISHEIASAVLNHLESERGFANKVVRDCLPNVCKDWAEPENPVFSGFVRASESVFASVATSTIRQATEEEIKEVESNIIQLIMKGVESGSILAAKEASTIIHGCIDDHKRLDSRRIKELKEIVHPFIYGDTPLFEALRKVIPLFRNTKYKKHKKLLFILSDGKPNDNGNTDEIKRELEGAEITVVSCYINKSPNIDPLHLFSKSDERWEDGAQFLFKLSTAIKTESLPKTVFIKKGWNVDIENNETRLFVQVNHPDNIKEVCELARDVVCTQDALSDMLASVSLDNYIKQSKTGLKARLQDAESCYANASAMVIHLSLKRILGRHEGYPNFDTLRQEIIDLYGLNAVVTFDALKGICPKYHLHCEKVDIFGAMKAITEKRPVVAEFGLTDSEWDIFTEFYYNNPTGILSKKDLDLRKQDRDDESGHAVVLTSFNSECLYLMNSWGDDWADMGFFRIQNTDVLDLEFIDVYWTEDDLCDSEKVYYQKYGAQVAADLICKLQGLQQARYTCPMCNIESLVTEFTGTLLNAKCPSCQESFPCGESGNILALNMYLLSLTRST